MQEHQLAMGIHRNDSLIPADASVVTGNSAAMVAAGTDTRYRKTYGFPCSNSSDGKVPTGQRRAGTCTGGSTGT